MTNFNELWEKREQRQREKNIKRRDKAIKRIENINDLIIKAKEREATNG